MREVSQSRPGRARSGKRSCNDILQNVGDDIIEIFEDMIADTAERSLAEKLQCPKEGNLMNILNKSKPGDGMVPLGKSPMGHLIKIENRLLSLSVLAEDEGEWGKRSVNLWEAFQVGRSEEGLSSGEGASAIVPPMMYAGVVSVKASLVDCLFSLEAEGLVTLINPTDQDQMILEDWKEAKKIYENEKQPNPIKNPKKLSSGEGVSAIVPPMMYKGVVAVEASQVAGAFVMPPNLYVSIY